ncbi:hypothetical protein BAX97_09120 [Elizabethkingia meningoseptica]|nr:hypothetical protein BAX97_09120 [Elizabethkingia meningoseptica]
MNTKAQNRFMLVMFLRHELLRNILLFIALAKLMEIFNWPGGMQTLRIVELFSLKNNSCLSWIRASDGASFWDFRK